MLVGLTGLAITQPVLDLMGQNPEFFIAGHYTSSQVLHFGLVVALVPPAVVAATYLLVRLVHRRAGEAVHAVLAAALGGVFGNVLLRGLGGDGTAPAAVATVLGAAAPLLLGRRRVGLLLLQNLALANLLFLGGFVLVSPASELIRSEVAPDARGLVSVPTPPGPVVVIVFDELPVSTLMRSDGTINEARYPAFARLAAGSTWFRNASSPHNRTERAIPAIVTGNVLEDRAMPNYLAFPRNLLSLMSTAVPVRRYEPVTDLCPPEACTRREGQPVRRAIEDSLVVYGHRVLPPPLREDLPAIDDAWGSFGAAVDEVVPHRNDGEAEPAAPTTSNPLERWHAASGAERSSLAQAARIAEQAQQIDAEPALHFIHGVLPHAPWFSTPWGTRLISPTPEWVEDPADPGYEWSGITRYQRHSLQAGLADVALGQVLDALEGDDVWDDATIVVTADHGTSTLQPDVGRDPTPANEDEVYRVPLLIKAAGQAEGRVVDDVAMTIDVLPTLIDLLGIETDWELDGHSLLDGSRPRIEPRVGDSIEPLLRIVERHEADLPYGDDWMALAAVGPAAGTAGRLVGTPLEDLAVGEPSALEASVDQAPAFAQVPTADGGAPQLVTGVVRSDDDGTPPPVVLVVNGTVAGVASGYRPSGEGTWRFSSLLGPVLREGENDLVLYEVGADRGRRVLRPMG